MTTIKQLLESKKNIGIFGLSKNAGKTTVLNRLLKEYEECTVGLTSLGRDGEAVDEVYGHQKPSIHVTEGALFATAKDLLLTSCTVTKRIHGTTGIGTPLGEVVLAEALSDGFIELAGPSQGAQLGLIANTLKGIGAEKVFIEGALNRQTFITQSLFDATIFVIGASHHPDMTTVVMDALEVVQRLRLPPVTQKLKQKINRALVTKNTVEHIGSKLLLFLEDQVIHLSMSTVLGNHQELIGLLKDYRAKDKETPYTLYMGDPVTKYFAHGLIKNARALLPLTLVVNDGTQLFMNKEQRGLMQQLGYQIKVLQQIIPTCIAYNPYAPVGYHFEEHDFRQQLLEHFSDIPIFNFYDKSSGREGLG